MKSTALLLFKVTVLLTAWLLAACNAEPGLSPEQEIRATLAAIESGVEKRSMSAIMEHVSNDYQDHHGHSRKDVQRLMQLQIIRNQNINIFTRISTIEIEDDFASVELSAAMASRELDLSLESNRLSADTAQFSLVLARENGAWKVRSGSWQRGW